MRTATISSQSIGGAACFCRKSNHRFLQCKDFLFLAAETSERHWDTDDPSYVVTQENCWKDSPCSEVELLHMRKHGSFEGPIAFLTRPETPLDAIGVVDSEFATHLVRLEKLNLGVAEGKSQAVRTRRMLDTPDETTGLRS